jgi:hypothetical protein
VSINCADFNDNIIDASCKDSPVLSLPVRTDDRHEVAQKISDRLTAVLISGADGEFARYLTGERASGSEAVFTDNQKIVLCSSREVRFASAL